MQIDAAQKDHHCRRHRFNFLRKKSAGIRQPFSRPMATGCYVSELDNSM
jgi:hypothetical protein